jgi:hypothetical protein
MTLLLITRILETQWIANDSFSGQPDKRRNAAWKSLYGQRNGFFLREGLVPQEPHMTVFSAYHQIHCLEHIWRGIWALRAAGDNSTLPATASMEGHETSHRPHHNPLDADTSTTVSSTCDMP